LQTNIDITTKDFLEDVNSGPHPTPANLADYQRPEVDHFREEDDKRDLINGMDVAISIFANGSLKEESRQISENNTQKIESEQKVREGSAAKSDKTPPSNLGRVLNIVASRLTTGVIDKLPHGHAIKNLVDEDNRRLNHMNNITIGRMFEELYHPKNAEEGKKLGRTLLSELSWHMDAFDGKDKDGKPESDVHKPMLHCWFDRCFTMCMLLPKLTSLREEMLTIHRCRGGCERSLYTNPQSPCPPFY
jgi:hypothetical protein